MKKLLLLPAVALMMASCGGGDYCSCAKEAAKMVTDAGKDADKLKAASDKGLECAKMLEGKSDDELKEMKECK